jgi:hypothetical protein
MLLAGKILTDFPIFKQYAYHNFRTILNSSTIVRNMETYGSLNKSAFGAALFPGMPPLVMLSSKFKASKSLLYSSDLGLGIGGAGIGCLLIADFMVERFEDDPHDPGNMFLTAKGRQVPVVGGGMLHHLCHWGNEEAGRIPGLLNRGDAFEIDTYGTYVTYTVY